MRDGPEFILNLLLILKKLSSFYVNNNGAFNCRVRINLVSFEKAALLFYKICLTYDGI